MSTMTTPPSPPGTTIEADPPDVPTVRIVREFDAPRASSSTARTSSPSS